MSRSLLQKLKPYYIRKAFRYLRHYGPKDFLIRVRERLAPEEVPYGPWYESHRADQRELERQARLYRKEYRNSASDRSFASDRDFAPDGSADQHHAEYRGAASAQKTDQHNVEYQSVASEPGSTPLFSVVVPAWRTPARYLEELLDSVLGQTFGDLELVIANASPDDEEMARILEARCSLDGRLRVLHLGENGGIAANTNAAIRAARGTFLCFMDHDDLIAPDALFEAWQLIRRGGIDLIYTDEDKIRDSGKGTLEHFQPHFKPDFNLDLLRSNNYICHFLMVRRTLVEEAGALSEEYDGAQDYEFILRLTDWITAGGDTGAAARAYADESISGRDSVGEATAGRAYADESVTGRDSESEAEAGRAYAGADAANRIAHIPRVLYHWRVHEQSTADNPDSKQYAYESGKRALEAHLARHGLRGEVSQTKDHGFYRVRYPVAGHPLVSIIIPNREGREMLERCIDAIRAHTKGWKYEVIVVENNSSSKEILDLYRKLRAEGVRVVRWKAGSGEPAFNFSAINNYGVRLAEGGYLVFMNNDVRVSEGWLEEMLGVCARPDVGAVGAKLIFPDGRIQSAGIVVGIGGIAGSLFTGMDGAFSGYLHKASLMQDLSAVTAALMMVKRSAFEAVGGFDEALAVAFNDVDLCLKLRQAGFLNVYDPFAKAVHDESASRGDEYTKENAERYRQEAALMKDRWREYYEKGDPCYNPNFSLDRWDYTLKP